jgi:hypothetical protein
VNDEHAAKLPDINQDMVGDEEAASSTMNKGLDPLVSNAARESSNRV